MDIEMMMELLFLQFVKWIEVLVVVIYFRVEF